MFKQDSWEKKNEIKLERTHTVPAMRWRNLDLILRNRIKEIKEKIVLTLMMKTRTKLIVTL